MTSVPTHRLAVAWDDRFAQYDFGPGHPMAPVRVQLAMRLAIDLGLLSKTNVSIIAPVEPASDEVLGLVHDVDYIEAVRKASEIPPVVDLVRGLGTDDDPVFPGMHEASARIVEGTRLAAREVWEGRVDHGVNLAGGLHHAMPGAAEGFCVYSDIGVAIADLLKQGAERIVYIDVDVHHGDGPQAIFWNDPRVLTISIHESPASLFPNTGWPTETGGPQAPFSAVNIALPAGTGDQGWLRAFHAVVPQLLEVFQPQVIVSQHGADAHFEDPLANLTLSIDGQRMAAEAIHRWAHAFADGRWVAVGGGGYEWVEVVPRTWANVIAIAGGHPVDPESDVPESFRAFTEAALGRQAPFRMTDGRNPWPKSFDDGYDPDDDVDRSILATRNALFPHYGLQVDAAHWF